MRILRHAESLPASRSQIGRRRGCKSRRTRRHAGRSRQFSPCGRLQGWAALAPEHRLGPTAAKSGLRRVRVNPPVSRQCRRNARFSMSSSARSRSISARMSSSIGTPGDDGEMCQRRPRWRHRAPGRSAPRPTAAAAGIGTRTAHSPARCRQRRNTDARPAAFPDAAPRPAAARLRRTARLPRPRHGCAPTVRPSCYPSRSSRLPSQFRPRTAAEGHVAQDDLVHLRAPRRSGPPRYVLDPLLVHLGIGQVEFDHHLFAPSAAVRAPPARRSARA